MGALFIRAAVALLVLYLSSWLCFAQDGEWSVTAQACIRNNNHWSGSATSLSACQRSCEEQTSFTCLSVDYSSGNCHHSRYNRYSIRPTSDFTQPCYAGGQWYWSERLDIDYAWSDVVKGCIRNNNDGEATTSTIEECQQRCIEEDDFVCLSIDYNNGRCLMSRFNSDSIRPTIDYTQPCYSHPSDFQYSERRDKKYYWTDTVLGCIRGNNEWTGTLSSIAACQKRCVDETGFTCLSIDWRESENECLLSRFNRNTLSTTADFTQPCYLSGYQYAERVDVGEWTPAVLGCIRGNNLGSSVTVPDLESCLLICSQNDDCCSVDYKDDHCHLSGKNKATVDPPSDYTEPCYLVGHYYAERVDKFCGY